MKNWGAGAILQKDKCRNCWCLEVCKYIKKVPVPRSDSCPVLCSGNGEYEKGHCVCRDGWKGAECDVPEEQCIDPTCFGHGTCIMGVCICVPGYKGDICEEGLCTFLLSAQRGWSLSWISTCFKVVRSSQRCDQLSVKQYCCSKLPLLSHTK